MVASPQAAEGIDAGDGEHLIIAYGPEDEAQACLRLIAEPDRAAAFGAAARARVEARYAWDATLAPPHMGDGCMSWPQRAQGWRAHLTLVGGLALAVVVLFHHDAIDMARIWWTSSTYGHCLFIPPLIGWLVWQRAGVLAQLDPATWGAGLAWLAGGALLWLLGDAASLGVLRHGGLIVMLQGVVAASLGPQVTRGLLFPLFYAFFLVPVGSELEPALQLLTAKMAMGLLGLVGIPAHIEGVFITTPTGYFKVAEACSGAKFVVAMAAYGVLVRHLRSAPGCGGRCSWSRHWWRACSRTACAASARSGSRMNGASKRRSA